MYRKGKNRDTSSQKSKGSQLPEGILSRVENRETILSKSKKPRRIARISQKNGTSRFTMRGSANATPIKVRRRNVDSQSGRSATTSLRMSKGSGNN